MKINRKENEDREKNKMKLRSIVFKPDKIYFSLPWYKLFLYFYYMVPQFSCWYPLTCFLPENIDPLVEPWRN